VQADPARGFRHGDQIGGGQRLKFGVNDDRHYDDLLSQEDGGTKEWADNSNSLGHTPTPIAMSSTLGIG
jgi:hypothetical protein